ncbi:FtsX-like permease family protein [Erysipelotrichaceae bacterium RD49]|nr:FtsX-like permease family protein [Erysipelotrichaceae bacterium RD49]
MAGKLILNDIKHNKLLSAATVFFMTISAALLILTTILGTELVTTIGSLMDQAQIPDLIQMHTGEIDTNQLAAFASSHPEIKNAQTNRFLNLENSQIVLNDHNLVDSTQDNGLVVQSEKFDYLLGMDSSLPQVNPGEVYVPISYREKYTLEIGDPMTIFGQPLIIAGFLRDAQMNSMMASSKRFLVSLADYERFKGLGQEEYLLEYQLNEGEDIHAFQSAYMEANLPANGPVITRPLILMINALSDGMMVFVILLVSIVVLMISMLCIHFILAIQMERDRKEVGLLKALGVNRKKIRRLYFSKYLLFSLAGGLLGLILAALFMQPMVSQLHELYGQADKPIVSILAALVAMVASEGIILFSIWNSLRKIDHLSALDALLSASKKGKSWVQYGLTGAVSAACTFLMLVPVNLSHTLADPSFVTYMGIGSGQIRMDVRLQDDRASTCQRMAKTLDQDDQVEQFTLLQTGSYPAVLADGSQINLTIEAGDHAIFPVRYSSGSAPAQPGEIALSSLNASELNLKVGDTVDLVVNDRLTPYTVFGIYSDITNGGKTAKIAGQLDAPVIWSVVYVSLKPEVDQQAWMARYQNLGVDVVKIADYVQDTYAQTLNQLQLVSDVVMIVGAVVILVVLGLFSRLLVEKDRYTISLQKALGLTNQACERIYFQKGMAAALAGIVLGLLFGLFGGQVLCQVILASFGAEGFRFVIDEVQTFLIIPATVLISSTLASGWGVRGIQTIKAYECCQGRE